RRAPHAGRERRVRCARHGVERGRARGLGASAFRGLQMNGTATVALPAPGLMLRHRPPALLLATVEAHTGRTLTCTGIDAGSWPWPRLLEGTAQAAGLLAGLPPGGPANGARIGEYPGGSLRGERHPRRVPLSARRRS